MSIRSNPFEELEQFFARMSRQFDDTSRGWTSDAWSSDGDVAAVDLVDEDGEFVATVDLPGFERDQVDVRVTDHTLRIRAEHDETAEMADEEYLRRERRHQSVRRSIRLPDEVDKENVRARMKNGVLTVTLPKSQVEASHSVEIAEE